MEEMRDHEPITPSERLLEELRTYTGSEENAEGTSHVKEVLEEAIGNAHKDVIDRLKEYGIAEAYSEVDSFISRTHFRLKAEQNGYGVMSYKEIALVHGAHSPQHVEQQIVETSNPFIDTIFSSLLEAMRNDMPTPDVYDDVLMTSVRAIDAAGLWMKLYDHYLPFQGSPDEVVKSYQFGAAMGQEEVRRFIIKNIRTDYIESALRGLVDFGRARHIQALDKVEQNPDDNDANAQAIVSSIFLHYWILSPLDSDARNKILHDLVRHMNFRALPLAQVHDLSDYRK